MLPLARASSRTGSLDALADCSAVDSFAAAESPCGFSPIRGWVDSAWSISAGLSGVAAARATSSSSAIEEYGARGHQVVDPARHVQADLQSLAQLGLARSP